MPIKTIGYDAFSYNGDLERLGQCHNTIINNSKYFDKSFLFCTTTKDADAYTSLKETDPDKCDVLLINGRERLRYVDLFRLVNELSGSDDIKAFANLDTTFGDEWKNVEMPDDRFMTLTNRTLECAEITEGENGINLFNRTGIIDKSRWANYNKPNLPSIINGRWLVAACGWAWKTIKDLDETEVYLGYPGSEAKWLRQVRRGGYVVGAGALRYPTYHNHLGGSDVSKNEKFRTVRGKERVDWASGDGQIYPNEVL